MKYLVFLLSAFLCLAIVNAGVVPNDGTSTNIQGPSSQSKIIGPDGSVITAQSPGGQIIHEETPEIFERAGHFLGPASPLINPAVPGMAARKVIDTIALGPARTVVADSGYFTNKEAKDGSSSIMGLKSPNGYMAAIDM